MYIVHWPNAVFYSPVYVDMYRDGAPSIGSQQGEANVYVQYQRKGDSLKCFRTISKMFTSNSSGKCLRPKSAETRLFKMFSSNISRKCLRPISAEMRLFKIWNWTTTACWHAKAKYSQAKISNTLLVDLWAALRMNSAAIVAFHKCWFLLNSTCHPFVYILNFTWNF